MTSCITAKLGVREHERFEYLQIDGGKTNLTAKSAGRWAHLTSMMLDNGDFVSVAEPWSPPEAMAGITEQQLQTVTAWLAANGPQRANPQAAGWFGWRAAELCGVPDAAGREDIVRSRGNTILKTLERRGMIRRTTGEHGRKDRPVWEAVDPAASAHLRTSAHLEN